MTLINREVADSFLAFHIAEYFERNWKGVKTDRYPSGILPPPNKGMSFVVADENSKTKYVEYELTAKALIESDFDVLVRNVQQSEESRARMTNLLYATFLKEE